MITVFRKHQKWLMYVITFFVIISFVWFYNRTNLSERSSDNAKVRAYDRDYSSHELARLDRQFGLVQTLFMIDLMQHLMGFEGQQHRLENLIVLRHEADALGIQPTNDQVEAAIQAMPAFQSNGAFDPQKYGAFVSEKLPPLGFTVIDLEEVVRDQLRLQKLKAIIDSTVTITPGDARVIYELRNQQVQLSVVRFKQADFVAAIQVSDEDVKTRFEKQKESLKSDEQRAIKFVEFAMSEQEKKLERRDRMAVLEKLKAKSEHFAMEMTAPDAKFDDVAKKTGAIVHETKPFSRKAPDAEIAASPLVVTEAFHRTEKEPDSDILRSADGFVVLHLVGITPSKPLTLEEAKPQLVEQIKTERATEMMGTKTAEVRKKIEAELKAGKSFADATTAAGVKAEQLAPFSNTEPNKDVPDAMELLGRSFEMAEGQLSEFVPNDDGGVLIHLDKRLPVDEAKFEKEKEGLAGMMLQNRREMAFQEWLRTRRTAAKFQAPGKS